MSRLIFSCLTETAARVPEHHALVCGPDRLPFAELERISNQLSQLLVELRARRGDRVGVALEKCNEYVCAQYGILKAACCYVPIDPHFPTTRIGQIIEDCGIEILFCDETLLQSLSTMPALPACLKHLIVHGVTAESIEAFKEHGAKERGINLVSFRESGTFSQQIQQKNHVLDVDLAYIMYTSGSTGKPKGVMINHRNILTYLEWARHEFALTIHDRMVNVAPFTFDISGIEIFGMADSGATMIIVKNQKVIGSILQTIDREKATFMSTVPTVIGTMVNTPRAFERFDLSSLRIVVTGAAICPPVFLQKLHTFLPQASLYNLYGPTEATIYCLFYKSDANALDIETPVPIGVPFFNTEAYVADDQGNEVPADTVGELVLRGAHVALGYYNNAEKTTAAFKPYRLQPHLNERVYHTGDIAKKGRDGNVHFLGRKDDMIKSRGYRIEINEIELALSLLSDKLTSFSVVAVPDTLIENRIYAACVPNPGVTLTTQAIREHCATKLPDYMVPDDVFFVEQLPTTSSGKVSRKDIVQKIQSGEWKVSA